MLPPDRLEHFEHSSLEDYIPEFQEQIRTNGHATSRIDQCH